MSSVVWSFSRDFNLPDRLCSKRQISINESAIEDAVETNLMLIERELAQQFNTTHSTII